MKTAYCSLHVVAIAAIVFTLAGCQSSGSAANSEPVSLHPDFGTWHRPIDTDSPEAQQWFDQGLQLLYGFNHDEAIRSFRRAGEIDPQCAMAWWGVSYAHGLHINNPEMTETQSREGYLAAQEAMKRIDHARPADRALIRAVATRYEWPVPEDRAHLDEAYADAMEQAYRAYRNDPDVGALYAEALMDLQPWDLYTLEGEPKGRAEEIVAVLEHVMRIASDHPGANHFYIHAVEASNSPERALAAANRLANLVPGSGHLVHMPSHIYIRLGRYADASDLNERAIEADRTFFERAPEPAFYGLYIVHNFHFLTYAAMMEGRYETAMKAARELEQQIPPRFLTEYVMIADGFMPTVRHVLIRFGRWNEILGEPAPPRERLVSRMMHHYARGIALSALGRPAEARDELDRLRSVSAQLTDEWLIGNNVAPDVAAIAEAMLEGEILYREGRHDQAFARLQEAAELEDQLKYDEPPAWMQPVRHALGALMIAAGRPADAVEVYRADLERNHGNGWSLLGLEQALRATDASANAREIQQIASARTRIWRRADVQPGYSCYCAERK